MASRTDSVSVNALDSTPRLQGLMFHFDNRDFRVEFARTVAYLRYQGFDPDVAEAAATEAITAAWEKKIKSNYRRGWVRTAAKRAAIRLVSKDDVARRLRVKGYEPPNKYLNGTEPYRIIEQRDELINAMRRLPDKQREVMILHLEHLTPKEISKELKMPRRTVSDLLTKARANLRKIIEENEREEVQ